MCGDDGDRRRESAPRDGDGDGAEERVWLKVCGKRGAARRPAAKKRAGAIPWTMHPHAILCPSSFFFHWLRKLSYVIIR